MGKQRTAAEKHHLETVAGMGCIVCSRAGNPGVPAEIHHIRAGQGTGQRASDYLVIPLCHDHHRTGGPGVAIHAGQRQWEALYGSELDLLAETIGRLRDEWARAWL